MNRASSVVVLLVVMPVLAGCVGSSPSDAAPANASDPDTAASGGGGTPPSRSAAATLTFGSGANVSEVRWENGTYQPQETCNLTGCATGDYERTVDLTELVPAGVPVVVTMNLSYDSGGVLGSTMIGWIQGSDVTFYSYDWDSPDPGEIRVRVLVHRPSSGTLSAVLQAYWPQSDTEPSVDYTLRLASRADAGVVPPTVPVSAALEPGQTLTADAAGDGPVAVRVYDPQDRYATRIAGDGQATWTVPDDAPSGRYVLVPPSGSAPVGLSVSGGNAPAMTALDATVEASEPRTYNGTGEISWSFDVEGHPLRVGVYLQDAWGSTTGFGPWVTAGPVNMEVAYPGGGSASGTFDCTPCFSIGSFGTAVASGIADEGLVPGTYTATVSSQGAAPFETGHYVVTYAR